MGQAAPAWDFFVSAAAADQPWAEWIAWQLEDAGYTVHLPAWESVPGSHWTARMQEGIRGAARTVAVVSTAYLVSVFSQNEWQAAIQADPQGIRRILLPLRIEECELPGLLGQVVPVDIFGLDAIEARARMVARVGDAIAGRAKPAAEPAFPGAAIDAPLPGPASNAPAFPGSPPGPEIRAESTGGRPSRRQRALVGRSDTEARAGRRYRALLIGVAEYEDPRLLGIRAAAQDVSGLAADLKRVGYTVEVQDQASLGGAALKKAVHEFLRSGATDDVLLLWLAGHGVRQAGRDFLVPSDASVDYYQFWDLCVPVDWSAVVARGEARQVFVFADTGCGARDLSTCRALSPAAGLGGHPPDEAGGGAAPDERQATTVVLMSDVQPSEDDHRCPDLRGRLAAAFRAVAADPERPATFQGFTRALRARLSAGMGDSAEPATVSFEHLVVRAAPDATTPLPPAASRRSTAVGSDHPWLLALEQRNAWKLAGDKPAAGLLHETTLALVARLAAARSELAASLATDPWTDEGFPLRMSERVTFLLDRMDPEELALSPAEAALLTTLPFLHDAFWASQAALAGAAGTPTLTSEGEGDAQAAFWRFARGYPRLLRRAEKARASGDETAVDGIGWWLTHRWLAYRPESYEPDALAGWWTGLGPAGFLAQVFDQETAVELIRVLRAPPNFLGRSDRRSGLDDLRLVGAATLREQSLRGKLVGYLLAVAYRMALDPIALPEVLVEHLGVADSVDLTHAKETLRAADWRPHGQTTRVLTARCHHPSLDVALRRYVDALDLLLGEVHRATAALPALAALPTRVTAVGVEAVASRGGDPTYSSPGARFRMAEDRVQELLMGEQLYSNRALAIRELYQNALDACRYRRAREQYLERAEGQSSTWTGRIDFRQGLDDKGNPFLECSDNGIGMGLSELTDVFAEAGTKSVDMPEVVEEMAKWAALDPLIEFFPNSRFGVGVLSYFMLADEITIDTCRLSRQGVPEDRLQVTIAGPGNLFRVRNLGPGRAAGTTVRLHLASRARQAPVSSVDVLTAILWVAEFETTAVDGAFSRGWRPGELSPHAPVGSSDPLASPYRPTKRIHATETAGVWWCDGGGAILADGLWIGAQLPGAVVDLRGDSRPELSVDRNKIIKHAAVDTVDRLLMAAIPALAASDAFAISFSWICNLAAILPVAADAILKFLVTAKNLAWPDSDGRKVPAAIVGCFPIDEELIPYYFNPQPVGSRSHHYQGISDFIIFNRLSRWRDAPGGTGDEIPAPIDGRPTDGILLRDPYQPDKLTGHQGVIRLEHLLVAAGCMRIPPSRAVRRLAELGAIVPSLRDVSTDEISAADLELLSRDLEGSPGFTNFAISAGHIGAASRRMGRPLADIVLRLGELGLLSGMVVDDSMTVTSVDLVILSRNLDGNAPWLTSRFVSVGHLLAACLKSGLPPAVVRDRLALFGHFAGSLDLFTRPDIQMTDFALLSREINGGDWLDVAPVKPGHLIAAAASTGLSPQQAAARLRELNFVVPDVRAREIDPSDPELVSRDHDSRAPWLGFAPVYRTTVCWKASRAGRRAEDVAERLRQLEMVVAVLRRPVRDRVDSDSSGTDLYAVFEQSRVTVVDLVSMARRTGRSTDEEGRWFRQNFHAVPDVDALVLTTDDMILLSGNLGGIGDLDQWLEPTGIGVAHVLAAAIQLRRDAGELAERLRHFGVAVADPNGATSARRVGADVELLSWPLGSLGPWRNADLVPHADLMLAAAQTGQAAVDLASRLDRLGLRTDRRGDLTPGPGDRDLFTEALSRPAGRPEAGTDTVGPAAVLATAFLTEREPAEVMERLRGAALAVQPPSQGAAVHDVGDLVLLSADLNGARPWLSSDRVPFVHLLAAAGRTGLPVSAVRRRLAELGLRTDPLERALLTDTVDPLDLIVVSENLDGQAPWIPDGPVSTAHVLLAASLLRLSADDVRARLARLGLAVAELPAGGWTSDDQALLAVALDGGEHPSDWHRHCWRTASDHVSAAQAMAVADFTDRPVRDVADRLAELGFSVDDVGTAPGALDAIDLVLISERLDGRGPWRGSGPVPLADVIAAAGHLRWTPERVARRMRELGLTTPDLVDSARETFVDGVDLVLMATSHRRNAATLPGTKISRAHLVANSHRFAQPVARIARRLTELGFDVGDASEVLDDLHTPA
jgi:hypothetical protein